MKVTPIEESLYKTSYARLDEDTVLMNPAFDKDRSEIWKRFKHESGYAIVINGELYFYDKKATEELWAGQKKKRKNSKD